MALPAINAIPNNQPPEEGIRFALAPRTGGKKCNICHERTRRNVVHLDARGDRIHSFCLRCLKEHISSQLSNRQTPRCPLCLKRIEYLQNTPMQALQQNHARRLAIQEFINLRPQILARLEFDARRDRIIDQIRLEPDALEIDDYMDGLRERNRELFNHFRNYRLARITGVTATCLGLGGLIAAVPLGLLLGKDLISGASPAIYLFGILQLCCKYFNENQRRILITKLNLMNPPIQEQEA